jgi:hypothetical protein
MPVVELGTMGANRARRCGKLVGAVELLQMKGNDWWYNALYTVQAVATSMSAIVFVAGAVTARDAPVADGEGSTLSINVPSHPVGDKWGSWRYFSEAHRPTNLCRPTDISRLKPSGGQDISPCVDNAFYTVFSEHAPFHFGWSADGAEPQWVGGPRTPARPGQLPCGR